MAKTCVTTLISRFNARPNEISDGFLKNEKVILKSYGNTRDLEKPKQSLKRRIKEFPLWHRRSRIWHHAAVGRIQSLAQELPYAMGMAKKIQLEDSTSQVQHLLAATVTKACSAVMQVDVETNGTESRIQKKPYICDQLVFDKGAKTIQWGKNCLFKRCSDNWTRTRTELDPALLSVGLQHIFFGGHNLIQCRPLPYSVH